MFSILTVNVILLLRTWAIWGKSRLVLGCLATLLTVRIVSTRVVHSIDRQMGFAALYTRARWCSNLRRHRYVSRLVCIPGLPGLIGADRPWSFSRPKWVTPADSNFRSLIVPVDYPVPGNVRPCATSFERTDVLYAIWISSIVWDTGTSSSLSSFTPLTPDSHPGNGSR